MKKRLNPLLDPRGFQERPILKLAPRVSLKQLRNGKILFYDNTKLSFCNYGETFVRIKERFREIGIKNFVDYRETVRGKDTKKLEAYTAMLAKEKPTAAVVALGDMGTSSATCIVTIALEKLGIPSVYITAPPGGELVEGVAVYRAGNLCLCKIDIYQASTKEEIREQIDLKWDYIIDSLTATGNKLKG
jgi:tRNA A37 threonylcarbamoyladenosine biosynthesis protein TsaE